MKIFVIAGHGAGDPGACAHGASEAERVRALAQRIKDLGGDDVILGDFGRNYYEDAGISWLDIPTDVPIVELHMDSAGEGARGGHVIIQAGIGGPDDWDRNLEALMRDIFPGRSITIVERGDLANPWRAHKRGYNYRLVENGFISNWDDLSTFNARIDDLAAGYLRAFGIDVKGEEQETEEDKMAMAPVTVPEVGTPVWRLYDHASGDHLLTASTAEKDALLEGGWRLEGKAWDNPTPSVALYRMRDPKTGEHLHTANFEEAQGLQLDGWEYEGVQLFGASDGLPVYRSFDPNGGKHMFTLNKAEHDNLVALGWRDEGIAFHV